MITTQSADSVLKSYYLDIVSDQLDKSVNPLLAAIQKTTADVWGRDVRKAVRVGVGRRRLSLARREYIPFDGERDF